MPDSARPPELKGKGIRKKGAGSGALFLPPRGSPRGRKVRRRPRLRPGSAVAPSAGIAAAAVMRGQRQPRLEAFELDAGAGPGPQQPVGGFAQRRTVLLRILYQRSVERGKKRRRCRYRPGRAAAWSIKDAGAFLLRATGSDPVSFRSGAASARSPARSRRTRQRRRSARSRG